jgi:WD40 repeat protein
MVWDLDLNCEKWILDKHQKEVNRVRFLEDKYLISSGMDGTIHISCMETGENVMKRTNLFKETNYSIVGLDISGSGLAMALDSKGNARAYDIFHH